MKKCWLALGIVWFAGAVTLGAGRIHISVNNLNRADIVMAATPVPSSDINSQINDANEEKESLEDEKERLQSDLADVESKKDNVVDYIQELDTKLIEITENMADNTSQIRKTRKQIIRLRARKRCAVKDKSNQYDIMKKRIKYMYENGDESYVKVLLDADSLMDLFNRSEYISKVTSYDKNLLKNYQKTCNNITRTQRAVRSKLRKLKEYKASLAYEKRTVNTLIKRKAAQLAKYEETIGDSSDLLDEYADKIAGQEAEVEKLLEEQRRQIAEQEARDREKAQATDTPSSTRKPSATRKPSSSGDDSSSDSTTGYGWPLAVSGTITSYFGYRDAPTEGASSYHQGIDISVPVGTSILASKGGTVVTATYSASAGNYIALYHGDGVYTYYMHCSSLKVSAGDTVSKGQKIALSGSTGVSTGPHLHFGVYMNGSYVNPLDYVSQ